MKHFMFDYKGNTYKIYSYTIKDKVGYNLLVSGKNPPYILKARDINQNGNIDTVITGSLSLHEVNRIYQAGLKNAQMSGNLENREIKRRYENEDRDYKYLVQTYLPLISDVYNIFSVMEKKKFGQTFVIKDCLADGSLDVMIIGKGVPASFQKQYETVLENAISENKLEKQESSYYVLLR